MVDFFLTHLIGLALFTGRVLVLPYIYLDGDLYYPWQRVDMTQVLGRRIVN